MVISIASVSDDWSSQYMTISACSVVMLLVVWQEEHAAYEKSCFNNSHMFESNFGKNGLLKKIQKL